MTSHEEAGDTTNAEMPETPSQDTTDNVETIKKTNIAEDADNSEKTDKTADSPKSTDTTPTTNTPCVEKENTNSMTTLHNETLNQNEQSGAILVPRSENSSDSSEEQKSNNEQDPKKDDNDHDNKGQSSQCLKITQTKLESDDMDEYDLDLFITEEEKKAFEYMLEQRREQIVRQKENFKNWVDSITRRRMFALSRLRKINICHKERMKFYEQINDYIKTADDVIKSSSNTTSTDLPSDGFIESESNNQTFENMVRENTGFIITNEKDSNHTKAINGEVSKSPNTKETLHHNNKKDVINNNNISKISYETTGNDVTFQNVDDDSKRTISTSKSKNTPEIVPVQLN